MTPNLASVDVKVPPAVQKGVTKFAFTRTIAFTVIVCCAIVTGGFYMTAKALAQEPNEQLVEKVVKDSIKPSLDEVRRAVEDMKRTMNVLDARLYELARGAKGG